MELVQIHAAAYHFLQLVHGILLTFAITLIPEYDRIIKHGAEALAPKGRSVILDLTEETGKIVRRIRFRGMTDMFLLRIPGCGMVRQSCPAQGQAHSGLSRHTRGVRGASIRTEQDGFPLTTGGNDDKKWKDQKFCEFKFLLLTRGHEQFGDLISKRPDNLPNWLFRLGIFITKPFGVSSEIAERRPWEVRQKCFHRMSYTEIFGGFAYIAAGKAQQNFIPNEGKEV